MQENTFSGTRGQCKNLCLQLQRQAPVMSPKDSFDQTCFPQVVPAQRMKAATDWKVSSYVRGGKVLLFMLFCHLPTYSLNFLPLYACCIKCFEPCGSLKKKKNKQNNKNKECEGKRNSVLSAYNKPPLNFYFSLQVKQRSISVSCHVSFHHIMFHASYSAFVLSLSPVL